MPLFPAFCSAVNCDAGFTYDECTVSCGGGVHTGTYHITTAAANGGTACAHDEGYTETQACNTGA